MNYDVVLSDLRLIEELVSDLRFAVLIAQDRGEDPRESIATFTSLDPNLLGAVLNLSDLLKP